MYKTIIIFNNQTLKFKKAASLLGKYKMKCQVKYILLWIKNHSKITQSYTFSSCIMIENF